VPPSLLTERWALTPPFHPYLRCVPCEDILKVFLQAITGIRHAGGMFSVALSVNSSTGFSLCSFRRSSSTSCRTRTDSSLCYWSPGVTRRVALLRCVELGLATAHPLTKWCPDFPPVYPEAAPKGFPDATKANQRSSSSPAVFYYTKPNPRHADLLAGVLSM